MSRLLSDLNGAFRIYAVELIALCAQEQIPVMIICTRRTAEEQAEAVRRGSSRVAHSKHQDGLAIDLCPYEEFSLHGPDKLAWSRSEPVWTRIGALAEDLGLRWGGRFGESSPGAGDGWDPGHAEFKT